VAYALSDEMKIIDLRWPWRSLTTSTVGDPSDSWASCFSYSTLALVPPMSITHTVYKVG